MKSKQIGRRRFLQGGAAAVGGLALGGMRSASGQEATPAPIIRNTGVRPLGEISRYEKLVRTGTRTDMHTPLQDLRGIITPSNLHFHMNHEAGLIPEIDPEKHRLTIFGMVERPLILTMAELKRLPSVTRIYFLECNSNGTPRRVKAGKTVQDTHGLTSCAEWTGVPLSLLLKEAGVQKGGTWLVAGSADTANHESSVPIEKAMSDGLAVYAQNGEALRIDQGYPLRLILPGYGGRINVKYLSKIKVVHEPFMNTQDRTSFMEHTPAGEGAFLLAGDKAHLYQYSSYPKSVITYPSGGHKLSGPGDYEISGLAWSGAGAVRRVEVTTDNGKTWKDAQLQEPVLRFAHTRFRLPWKWNGEEAALQSRCTDENGDVQASVTELNKNWAIDSEEACTSVMGEDCNRIPRRANRAYIQSWRVTRDGSVENATAAVMPEDEVIKGGVIHEQHH